MSDTQEFFYKLPGLLGGRLPGAHRSRSIGSGLTFASHRRLFEHTDPRRLDLRASLRDIHKQWLVRANQQRSSVNIEVIIDVSASMQFGSAHSKLDVSCEFIEALGYSAVRQGDAVGMIGFDRSARDDLLIPPAKSRGVGMAMSELLQRCQTLSPQPSNITGLRECVERIASRRSLVFIVSDFHWSLAGLSPILDMLEPALVVPIVVWDKAELQAPEAKGWLSVTDSEIGQHRNIWLRESIRKKWRKNVANRRTQLIGTFKRNDIKPFFIDDHFYADRMTQHFMDQVA